MSMRLMFEVTSRLSAPLKRVLRKVVGKSETMWLRVVMDCETDQFVKSLEHQSMHALEISGNKWKDFPFASYRSAHYPEYDWCNGLLGESAFDIIIAEQVLEHVQWPYRAVQNAYRMLRPGGVFVVNTPFLVKIHNIPIDCCRWTPLGMKYLLAEGGFPQDSIDVQSWGNRRCVRSNFTNWIGWIPWWHSLRNEPDFPIVVWAFARKPVDGSK
jgi:SAM-dependent methyltransferase